MKQNKTKLFGFTLIELMVAITIIGILALGISNVNFRSMSDNQRLKIYTNEIVNNIELIRNNALMGKGVTSSLIVPDSWKIDFSFAGSGKILTSYDLGSGAGYESYSNFDTIFSDYYYIKSIKCLELDGDENNLLNTGTGSLIIKQNKLYLSGDCASSEKILEIITAYKGFENTISINTVSGLVERDY